MKRSKIIELLNAFSDIKGTEKAKEIVDKAINYSIDLKNFSYEKVMSFIGNLRSSKLGGEAIERNRTIQHLLDYIKKEKNNKQLNIRYSDFHKPVFEFLNKNELDEFSYLEYEEDGQQYNGEYVKYSNQNCVVTIYEKRFEVTFKIETGEEGTIYSKDLNIYWLVGILTWYNLIDKNYKQ